MSKRKWEWFSDEWIKENEWKKMNRRMNERMRERMDVKMNEWKDEWMKEEMKEIMNYKKKLGMSEMWIWN